VAVWLCVCMCKWDVGLFGCVYACAKEMWAV
jgi:hypothetical protein